MTLAPETAIASIIAQARARWPGAAFDEAALAQRWSTESADGPPPRELPPFAVEVALAHACVAGDAAALGHFHREMLAPTSRVLARLGLDGADIDDVMQDVRAKLLVGEQPRLAQYEGTGPLAPWVSAVVGREGLSLLRRRRVTTELDVDALLDAAADPELAAIHARHGADLKAAFQAAVADLPPRDRAVLRALVIDDQSVGDIAALYKIHRVTASRWIADIRHTLLRETRRRLQQRLKLDAASLDSALRILDSGLEMSLHRLLARPPVP